MTGSEGRPTATIVRLPEGAERSARSPLPPGGSAEILLFTGVRYERPPAEPASPPGRRPTPLPRRRRS